MIVFAALFSARSLRKLSLMFPPLLLLSSLQMMAHHSTGAWFDTGRVVTLDGEITRLDWVNPHIILHLKGKNASGQEETWIIQGMAPNTAIRAGVIREEMHVGTRIIVRAHPPRSALRFSGQSVSVGSEAQKTSKIFEAGEILLSNGQTRMFGRGPGFDGLP